MHLYSMVIKVLHSSIFQQFTNPCLSSLSHSVTEEMKLLVTLPTLSYQDRETHQEAVPSAPEPTGSRILLSAAMSYRRGFV